MLTNHVFYTSNKLIHPVKEKNISSASANGQKQINFYQKKLKGTLKILKYF